MSSSDAVVVPSKMRAVVLDGPGFANLKVREVPVPEPGPEQLLARVDAAGICTSLIKLIEQGSEHRLLSGWDVSRWPLILGDEGAVTLVKTGEKLSGKYKPGQRFVVQPAVSCAPINHRDRYADNAAGVNKVAVGYTLPGHLAEYMLIPEEVTTSRCLLPLPNDSIPASHAAICEPVSCCISAQDHHMHLRQDDPLGERAAIKGLKRGGITVIIGAGAMGRMHVDLAMSYRPAVIAVSDLIKERLDLVDRLFSERARKLGILLTLVDGNKMDLKPYVDELTRHQGADDVIVAVGVKSVIEAAQHLVGFGGVLDLFGGLKTGQDVVDLVTGIVHYREINVTGSSGGAPWDVARALELTAGGEIDMASHITRIGDLDHAPKFLEMIKAQQLDGKAVVYPHRRATKIKSVSRWTAEDERMYVGGR